MIRNDLLVALRSLLRQRIYSVVNVTALAVGVASFVLIALYVDFERGFDRFHENSDRIHRVVHRQPGNIFLGSDHFAVTPAPLASAMVAEIPEVVDATALSARGRLLQSGDNAFYETGLEADERFFSVFSFKVLTGPSSPSRCR